MADGTIQIDLPWRFERVYLREVNIKLHDTPDLFDMKWQPKADMNIRNDFRQAGEDRYEVAIQLSLTCKNLDKLALEMTLAQAALIRVPAGKGQEDIQRIVTIEAPNALFPYVREAVDNLAVRMTLPPMLLTHFDFAKILEEGMRQMNLKNTQSAMRAKPGAEDIVN